MIDFIKDEVEVLIEVFKTSSLFSYLPTPFYYANQNLNYASIGTEFHLRTQLDVAFARERSAKISLFLVDLPFGFLRVFLFFVTLGSAQPVWPPLAMKNISCFFLQLVQLRMVEQRRSELQDLISQTNECAEEYRIHRAKLWHQQQEERFLEDQLTGNAVWTIRSVTLGLLSALWNSVFSTTSRGRGPRRKSRKDSTASISSKKSVGYDQS